MQSKPLGLVAAALVFLAACSAGVWAEAAIEGIEGQRLTLYKSVEGGPSLIDREAGEPAPPKPESDAT